MFLFKIFFIFFFMIFSTFSTHADNRMSRCEELVMPLCRGLWYNRTRMPNMFNHETQEEAGLQAHQFMHLVTIKCSPDLHFFLCSIYTPICVANYDKPLPPCRSICQRSKDGCTPLLKKYGFSWPAQMTCDQFPEKPTDKQLCMERNIIHTTSESVIVKSVTKPSVEEIHTNEKTLGNENRSQNGRWCRCDCTAPMIKINSVQHTYYNKVHTGGILNCGWPCRSPFVQKHQYRLISLWLSISVGLIFLSCLANILTFILNHSALKKAPHRFILYICCCQIGMSIGVIIRLVAGHYKTVCFQPDNKPMQESLLLLLRFQNSAPSVCSISFLFTYFFFLASVLWWWVLCITWFLREGLGWTTTMIDKYSQLYHFISWFIPGILSMLALTMSAVDGDPVTGLCLVGNINREHLITFLLAPLCVCTCSGFFFLACGFFTINQTDPSTINRTKLSITASTRPLSRNTSAESASSSLPKIANTNVSRYFYGILGFICSVPLCITMGSIIYEMRWRNQWELITTCPCLNKISPNSYMATPTISLYALKYFGFFAMGIICGPWVWPNYAFQSWLGPILYTLCCFSNQQERFLKPKHQPQQFYNTTYTIKTSSHRHDKLLEPSNTNDSLIMSSIRPQQKCHHIFSPNKSIDATMDGTVSEDTDSYASYQTLSHFSQTPIPNNQGIIECYKGISHTNNWPQFH